MHLKQVFHCCNECSSVHLGRQCNFSSIAHFQRRGNSRFFTWFAENNSKIIKIQHQSDTWLGKRYEHVYQSVVTSCGVPTEHKHYTACGDGQIYDWLHVVFSIVTILLIRSMSVCWKMTNNTKVCVKISWLTNEKNPKQPFLTFLFHSLQHRGRSQWSLHFLEWALLQEELVHFNVVLNLPTKLVSKWVMDYKINDLEWVSISVLR